MTDAPIDDAWRLLRAQEDELAAAVGDKIAGICRLRIATLLDNPAEVARVGDRVPAERRAALPSWPSSTLFDDEDRACLAFTEQFVLDVAGIDDALVGAVAAHRAAADVYVFARWVQANEARQRAELVLRHHADSGRFT